MGLLHALAETGGGPESGCTSIVRRWRSVRPGDRRGDVFVTAGQSCRSRGRVEVPAAEIGRVTRRKVLVGLSGPGFYCRGGGAWISTKKRPFGSGMMAARTPPCNVAGSPPVDTTVGAGGLQPRDRRVEIAEPELKSRRARILKARTDRRAGSHPSPRRTRCAAAIPESARWSAAAARLSDPSDPAAGCVPTSPICGWICSTSRYTFIVCSVSATVMRTRAPMMLLSAGAVVSGIGLGCSNSTKWPSGSATMTPRARLPAPKASGSPPVVTTGTPARLSGANAASMSRTIRIKVVPPGSCGRGRAAFRSEPFDLDHLDADGGSRNPRGDEAQLRPRHAEHLEQRRIGVVGARPRRLRRRNGEAEQRPVELDRLVEIGDDRAVVPRADDDVTRRRRARHRRWRLRHQRAGTGQQNQNARHRTSDDACRRRHVPSHPTIRTISTDCGHEATKKTINPISRGSVSFVADDLRSLLCVLLRPQVRSYLRS